MCPQADSISNIMVLPSASPREGAHTKRCRARQDGAGEDERVHLAPLEAIAAGGPTQAEAWLARYHGPWAGDVSRIFEEAEV